MYNSPYSTTPYGGSLYNNSASTNSNDVSAMFPAIFNLVNNTKNLTSMGQQEPTPTPIEEIQVILNNLPVEQRQAIETSQEYLELKSEIFQEFLLWSIAATDMGRAYLLGPGSHKSKKLLELTKDLVTTIGSKTRNRIQELEQQLAIQQELVRKQEAEFTAFKAQFESPSKSN